MTTITWPTDSEKVVVDAIRTAIGRPTYWYILASTIECPTCLADGDLYDPVNESSTDSFCPTCSGLYYIPVYSGSEIDAHITWGKSEQLGWYTGGQQMEGDCRVQIEYTTANLNAVDNAKWVIVDGKRMEVKKKILRGVQTINRILVDLDEQEKE